MKEWREDPRAAEVRRRQHLVIALVLASIWMHRDAVATGRRFWPFALVTLVLGSAGPLTYLLVRTFSTSCAVPPRKVTATAPTVAGR